MQTKALRYFWFLDTEVPADFLRDYAGALSSRPETQLTRYVRLLQARVPIPPRVFLTPAFKKALSTGKPTPDFFQELEYVIHRTETVSHARLGAADRPLLLTLQGDFCGSIRGIGACETSLRAMIHHYGLDAAYTLFVDFLESFSTLVLGAPHTNFRETFGIQGHREGGAGGLVNLSEDQFLRYIREYQNLISQKVGKPFPQAPEQQLLLAMVRAAKTSQGAGAGDEIYLSAEAHCPLYGQATVGVAYTRNPFNGAKELYGLYQERGEGKKYSIEFSDKDNAEERASSLREKHPATYGLLKRYLPQIEACYRDVVETEFVTDEDGHLFFRSFDKSEKTARAAAVSAIDLNLSGSISDGEAIKRIKPADVEVLLHPTLDDESRNRLKDLGSRGVAAAPGTAVGHVYFKMADAMAHYKNAKTKEEKRVILIADELLISDTPGLGLITGLVTKAAGLASHAAVMARANGIPCLVGYKGLEFDPEGKFMTVNGTRISSGTLLTLEAGSEGRLYEGEGRLQNLSHKEGIVHDISQLVTRVIQKENIPLQVRVNINNSKDAATGLVFGADGVGLCRTENMFMEAESLREIRNVVFSQNPDACGESFKKLEEIQFQDFKKIFEVMRERVVNIRLMDLPLHDFVPQTEAIFEEVCAQLPHLSHEHIRAVADGLREHNPMLGLRACRFGLITPQVYDMQIRAIIRAAYSVTQTGVELNVGIMFPLVFTEAELTALRARVISIEETIREQLKIPYGTKLKLKVGSMIELPAAALGADSLAKVGEFFAFGTNDLSQTTLGISRDDSAHYLPFYIENGYLPSDPFKVLAAPVRELIQTAVIRGRRVRGDASFGICGEQGGDRSTLGFCLRQGLNYVSCSPFRVLPARIALVHEALNAVDRGELKLVQREAFAAA